MAGLCFVLRYFQYTKWSITPMPPIFTVECGSWEVLGVDGNWDATVSASPPVRKERVGMGHPGVLG